MNSINKFTNEFTVNSMTELFVVAVSQSFHYLLHYIYMYFYYHLNSYTVCPFVNS